MSVLAELEKHAQNPDDKYQGKPFKTGAPGMSEQEEMMQASVIPGQSLTQSPDSKMPYETAPEFTDLQEFIEDSFMRISDPEQLPRLLGILNKGVPVEHVAQKFLQGAVNKGKINTDLMLLAIEPTIYTMITMATYGGVDPVLYPEDDMIDQEPSAKDVFRKASSDMFEEEEKADEPLINNLQAPATLPRSLLARGKQAVEALGGENELT